MLAANSVAANHPAVSPCISPAHDPIRAFADLWIAADERRAAMVAKWQRLETSLFARARRIGVSCEDASNTDLAEAQEMRELAVQIESLDQRLDQVAGAARSMEAATIAGALAKVDLALRVQGADEWREHALELAQGGLGDLRRLAQLS